MDAFFASVEQRDHVELRGQAVAVGGSPTGRGVVAAASYEAREFGVRSAMPSWQALRKCPHLIFVKPRFEAYKEASDQIRVIFREYTDLVEPLSLDEAYLDITENKRGIKSARQIAMEIKNRILAETGLTASAGIAVNKFVAKIASDLDKPDGLAVITPEKMIPFLEKLPVGKFHGIGKATEKKMLAMGIMNGADLKQLEETELVRHFGKTGRFYYRIVRGDDDRPVQPERIRKSVGAENTYSTDIENPDEIKSRLRQIAEKVAIRMQRAEAMGKTITLKVRYANFETVTRSQTEAAFISDEETIFKIAAGMLELTEVGQRSVRLLGISVSNLNLAERTKSSGEQLTFNWDD